MLDNSYLLAMEEKVEIIDELLGNYTVASAESLTSGLIAYGLSKLGERWIYSELTYATDTKIDRLSVNKQSIDDYTAVSMAVAEEMAEGMYSLTDADYVISATGWAGPDGDDVGLVYIGLKTPWYTATREYRFNGNRRQIAEKSALAAMDPLIEHLEREHTQYNRYEPDTQQDIIRNSYIDELFSVSWETGQRLFRHSRFISVVDFATGGLVPFFITGVPLAGGWYRGGITGNRTKCMDYCQMDPEIASQRIKHDYNADIGVAILENEYNMMISISSRETTVTFHHKSENNPAEPYATAELMFYDLNQFLDHILQDPQSPTHEIYLYTR